MRKRSGRLFAGLLTATLLAGCISPAVTVSAAEQDGSAEWTVTAEENDIKNADADENGFVIKNGVLTGYTGEGGAVVIPDGVTSIGDQAFWECSGLTEITIPEGVTSIGRAAFYCCSGLTEIMIPGSVTSIGNSAFEGCSSLNGIEVDEVNTEYASEDGVLYDKDKSLLISCPGGKRGKVDIPGSVTSIGHSAFAHCSGITEITIPEGVTSIGDRAFCGCNGITEIMIPEGVTSIGGSAFVSCSGMTEITIPSSVMSIGGFTFSGCSSLNGIEVDEANTEYASKDGVLYNKDKSSLISYPGGKKGKVDIPSSVTSIGGAAFYRCVSITEITIPSSVTSIGYAAFGGCSGLTEITIPSSVTSIGDSAFNDCSGLTEITIPSSVTSIGDHAFYGCVSITEITIPSSVTSIGDSAFYGCVSITEITIPSSVTSIGNSAFYGCVSITEITIPSSVTSIGENTFSNCSGMVIYCEKGSYAREYAIDNDIPYKYIGEKDNQTITATDFTKTLGDAAFSLGATTDGDGTLTYESDNPSVATVDGNGTVTIIGAGTAHITITAAETDTYNAAAKTITITVKQAEKKAQTITASDITKTLGDAAFSLGATTNGDGTLTYESDNTSVATVDAGGIVTIAGAGTAHITITASETDTYNATKKTITITVKQAEKKAQTITAADITKTLGDAAFSLGATTDGDGKLTYKSDNLSVATVDGNGTVTIIGAGTAHITITASETDTYNAAAKTITITVKQAEKKAQTITAKNIAKTYGAKAFSLGAKTNGGGKLTYKVVNPKVATVNTKGKVTIKGCGKTQIKITAAEKGNYKKTTKTITLTVKPKKATITSAKSTKSQTVTVKWKADKTAGGYIIQCATDKNFKKNVKTVTVSKYKTVSKNVTKLKGGKTYYVRVCAYTTANGEKIKGSYSKVLTVKVKK